MKKKIAITSTIPVEVIFSAGLIPVDLNNIFITHKNKLSLIQKAEKAGIPRSFCAWVKGIYGALFETNITTVIIVTQGDCSSLVALLDILLVKGIDVIPFSYPADNNKDELTYEIDKLILRFKTSWDSVQKMKKQLDSIRSKVHAIDYLTWHDNIVSGFENHYYTVCTSDMNGNCKNFEKEIDLFLKKIKSRSPQKQKVRLGYIGVPPIVSDLYSYVSHLDARVVFNEVQRQFSMPSPSQDVVTQYLLYTYPYRINSKITDMKHAVKKRGLDGIIHYVQSFCHHQAEHLIIKDNLDIPILLLECDYPGTLDARSKMRIESFINMLKVKKNEYRN